MKRFLLAIILTLAAPALAQTPTPSPVPTGVAISLGDQARADRWDRIRIKLNRDVCRAARLPITCTQAQARAVLGNSAEVYNSLDDLYERNVSKEAFERLKALAAAVDDDDGCTAFWSDNAATRNAWCAARGLPNGCGPCQRPTPTPTP